VTDRPDRGGAGGDHHRVGDPGPADRLRRGRAAGGAGGRGRPLRPGRATTCWRAATTPTCWTAATGRDTADYSASNIGVRADLLARIGQGGHAQGDEYVSIENLAGSAFADQLFGTGGRQHAGRRRTATISWRGSAATTGWRAARATTGWTAAWAPTSLIGGDGRDAADYSDSAEAVVGEPGRRHGRRRRGRGRYAVRGGGRDRLQPVADTLTGDGADNRLQSAAAAPTGWSAAAATTRWKAVAAATICAATAGPTGPPTG
jgi:hypothetical protein